jgi:hypothetical protein
VEAHLEGRERCFGDRAEPGGRSRLRILLIPLIGYPGAAYLGGLPERAVPCWS